VKYYYRIVFLDSDTVKSWHLVFVVKNMQSAVRFERCGISRRLRSYFKTRFRYF